MFTNFLFNPFSCVQLEYTKSKLNEVFYIKYQNITRGYSDDVEAHLALDEVEAQSHGCSSPT